MVCSAENFQENNNMFTYEWLGMPSECGLSRVIDRSITSATNPQKAIAHAKALLRGSATLPAGKPFAVRVLNNASILIWTGTIHDA
jgi:hypothetical protein